MRPVCTACGFVFYIDPKLTVIALVPYRGGLVMVRRSIEPGYGLWVVPGGFVDVGEQGGGRGGAGNPGGSEPQRPGGTPP